MSDCPKCWDTPCTCSEGYLGSKIYEYEQLKEKYKSDLDAANEEINRLREDLGDIRLECSSSAPDVVDMCNQALKESKERYPRCFL